MAINAINITGPVCQTSYGIVTQNIIKSLINKGLKVSFRPIGALDPDIGCGYDKYIDKCEPKFIPGAAHLIIWHQFDLKKYLQPNTINIGFPIFELDRFNEREQENLNSCQALVTCSKWGVDILRKFCPNKPLAAVPLGIDADIFSPSNTKNDKIVKFLTAGKWEVRKNQFAVMKAFSEVFSYDIRDVSLTYFCNNDFISEDNKKWENLAYKIGFNQNIQVISERLTSHKDVALFLNNYDVGVFPSRAEGWGLEASEMLFLGKEIIATNYSGHTEFLNKDDSYLIDIDRMEDAFDFRWFFGQGQWAEFGPDQFNQLKTHMLSAYNSVKKGLTKHSKSGTMHTWSTSADSLMKFLENLQ